MITMITGICIQHNHDNVLGVNIMFFGARVMQVGTFKGTPFTNLFCLHACILFNNVILNKLYVIYIK